MTLTGPVGNIAEPANGGTPAPAVVTGTVTALPAGGGSLGVDVVITLASSDGIKTGIWSLTVCASV